MKSRSHGSIPGTWSGGRQLMRSARIPSSSKWWTARPNSSPSGPPQCWPNTPHTPCRQRRKLTQTGIPLCTSASTAPNVSPSRTSVIVSSRTRSGGSSSKTRGRSSSISLPRLAVDVAVDAEGERRVAGAAGLLDRLAPDAQAAPGDVHPVHRGRERGAGAAVELAGQPPRVRRDHVAAGVEVGAVDVADGVGLVDQRPRAPERLVLARRRVGPQAPELGGDAAVEHHAALPAEQLLEPSVGRARGSPRLRDRRHA